MKFGHFDDRAREYVIDTPATPLPWINYLGSEEFFGLISNTMGGYCFYRDAKLQRLLRYRYNSVPGDVGGQFYYIKEAGKPAWNPGFLPTRTPLDSYQCRHGMGYTLFDSEKDGLEASVTCLVPLRENCELHDLTLTNHSGGTNYGCVEGPSWRSRAYLAENLPLMGRSTRGMNWTACWPRLRPFLCRRRAPPTSPLWW